MDLSVTHDTVRIYSPAFSGAADHPLESDMLLPDYCPDIARILQTEAGVTVDSKMLAQNALTINGTFCVKIIYVPENTSAIRCFTYETAFSHSMETGEVEKAAYIKVDTRVNYVNCNPIGPRRVQIKAAIGISANVFCEKEEDLITGCDDARVETQKKQVKASCITGTAEKQFKVNDDLDIGMGKPAAAAIVKSTAVALPQDYKVLQGKVVAKGEIMLRTVYAPDLSDPHLEVAEHSIPISQIIDLPGVNEGCVCNVEFDVGGTKVETMTGDDGENNKFAVEITVNATVHARRTQEFEVISDAYSPQFEMRTETKALNLEYVIDMLKMNELVRQTVDLAGVEATVLTDCSAKTFVRGMKTNDGKLTISGDMNVSIIAADAQGGPVCIEKVLPFSIAAELKEQVSDMRCEPRVNVVSVSGTLSSPDKIDLRIECMVTGVLYASSHEDVVSMMELDEEKPKACKKTALTLYFCDKGESVWEIAKKYDTSVAAVRQENSLEGETVPERRMLLIPKKRCVKS